MELEIFTQGQVRATLRHKGKALVLDIRGIESTAEAGRILEACKERLPQGLGEITVRIYASAQAKGQFAKAQERRGARAA